MSRKYYSIPSKNTEKLRTYKIQIDVSILSLKYSAFSSNYYTLLTTHTIQFQKMPQCFENRKKEIGLFNHSFYCHRHKTAICPQKNPQKDTSPREIKQLNQSDAIPNSLKKGRPMAIVSAFPFTREH